MSKGFSVFSLFAFKMRDIEEKSILIFFSLRMPAFDPEWLSQSQEGILHITGEEAICGFYISFT
jgi:hypothetical protein